MATAQKVQQPADGANGEPGNMDHLLHLETMFEELGREDGLRDGAVVGQVEGRVAGVERGYLMAKEAGFYLGVAEMWLQAAERKDGGVVPARAVKSLQTLLTHARAYPTTNIRGGGEHGPLDALDDAVNLDLDPTTALARLRGRCKAVRAMLGPVAAEQRYAEEAAQPEMSF
ncbi:hypothetical protein BDK51DRAFT_51308 [Blyttiomyces helicus]|uniref:Essential protein Yae1 N-terminal domain-containing protein n=1 Tax=Blyttiomyces helicus TaxID=388810 RepID=A0A4P9WQI6_9FUNG|nr:hypothetical protein BDK51DRAFT_51308 [Blyttiomyces helicus]|eukprot:RKO94078.1 hypothetical protein BDK51DRAFT_51308 [Blyttiomyces helicus]